MHFYKKGISSSGFDKPGSLKGLISRDPYTVFLDKQKWDMLGTLAPVRRPLSLEHAEVPKEGVGVALLRGSGHRGHNSRQLQQGPRRLI